MIHDLVGVEADKLLRDPTTFVLDVRTQMEFKGGSLARAVLIPVDELEKRMDEIGMDKNKTIVVYCAHGVRSLFAKSLLEKNGYTQVYNLAGGITHYLSSRR